MQRTWAKTGSVHERGSMFRQSLRSIVLCCRFERQPISKRERCDRGTLVSSVAQMQVHCAGHRQVGGNNEQRLQSPTASSSSSGDRQDCAGCQKPISERYLLRALDRYWHEDCLKCSCCDCRLGEVGSTLYTKANLLLCRRDYLR